jgi:glycerol dehydrogenase-like iron-containing ADH family enzyme
MAGDDSILYDKNQKNVLEAIRNHLTKTEIPFLLSELDRYDSILEEAKKNADKLKKKLKVLLLSQIEQ